MDTKTILLAEDDRDDAYLMQNACHEANITHGLVHAKDGAEAIDYLAGTGAYANQVKHQVPDLIFLDIKMPRKNGHEVLEWIRKQPALQYVPIIMLTGSDDPGDIDRAYQLGVSSYLLKTANQVEFRMAVGVILKYWLCLNTPPLLMR